MKQFEKYQVQELQVSYLGNLPAKALQINSSKDAFRVLQQAWNPNTIGFQETFQVLLLNNANQVKGIYKLSIGSVTGTLVDIRLLFGVVLKSVSTAIIIAHNHPSGKMNASEADKQLTRKIQQAAEYLDIKVLDHIILSPFDDYYSFADNGML